MKRKLKNLQVRVGLLSLEVASLKIPAKIPKILNAGYNLTMAKVAMQNARDWLKDLEKVLDHVEKKGLS